MASGPRDSERLATLGSSLAAGVRLVVTCRGCGHQVELREPEISDQVARHGAGLSLLEWASRLVCSHCGGRKVDFVVSGYQPPFADRT